MIADMILIAGAIIIAIPLLDAIGSEEPPEYDEDDYYRFD